MLVFWSVLYGCFLKIVGFSPQIIHFQRVFHYKPIHFGVPLFLETPNWLLLRVFRQERDVGQGWRLSKFKLGLGITWGRLNRLRSKKARCFLNDTPPKTNMTMERKTGEA